MNNVDIDDWCDYDFKDMQNQEIAQGNKDHKLVAKLRKKLKPKVMNFIYQEIDHHMYCFNLAIVTKDLCRGNKLKGSHYFGESTPVRFVFEDVKTFFEDSYSGTIFIRIDRDRYLKMDVHG